MTNLLAYRFIVLNALLFTFVAALTLNGIVWPIFEQDASRISYGIVALFAVGWLGVAREVCVAAGALNRNKRLGARPAVHAEATKDMAKVEWLSRASEWLVGLGLIGTVVGFKVALSGIDQGSVSDASGAQGAVATLMVGMGIALNTTLLGASLAIWHELNCLLLRTGLEVYWSDRLAANDGIGNVRGID